jgi:hypothetical protein
MINYGLILQFNYPGTQWVLSGNTYAGLDWLDESAKPTQEELDALWPVTEENNAKQNCKTQATQILTSTDWTSIPDVADPAASNPYLMNQSEFLAYRSQIRALAVTPVVDPVWPTAPTTQWSST